MNLELFIAKRVVFDIKKSFSRFIIFIAVAAVALSLMMMIIATSLVNGFQKEISSKVYGFWGHIHITRLGFGQTLEDNPISADRDLYALLDTMKSIRHIQVFANKPGIIKTSDQIEGIILKGVGADFDWQFFDKFLVKGKAFNTSDSIISRDILISSQTANRLQLDTGDRVNVYFIQNPPRVRRLTVSGIYNSGLEEYDKYYALVDIRHVQRLNDWKENQIGGLEVFVKDPKDMTYLADELHYNILGPNLTAQTIKEIYPNIFDWLGMQNMNEIVILTLMVVVAAFNMITCLLILILDRTNMIGILRSLGLQSASVRKIFMYKAAYILGLGLLIGNALGIGLCFAQEYFHLIKLPEASYYVSEAPVELNLLHIVVINIGTFLISIESLMVPSYLATTISPIKTIRFK